VGVWTAHNLLKTDHKIIVFCANEDKLYHIFPDKTEKFHKVIKMDFEHSVISFENGGENPFLSHLEGVDILINCLGPYKKRDVNHSRLIDLEANKLLIAASKTHNIQKYIFVSSMFVTRPDELTSFIQNTSVGNCLGHKMEAENILRESGLNYVIVRPGELPGGIKADKRQMVEMERLYPVEQPVIK
jgi:uncharacterized protein YbjT (DUF2867 family)